MGERALHFTDFSGGETDNYLDCPPNQGEKFQNFLIKNNKKLETRPGTDIYDTSLYQIPAGITRVSSLPKIENDVLFFQSTRNLYYQASSAWQTLVGPSSNLTLAAGTTSNYASWAEWQNHLLVTTDAFGSPMKIYRDDSSTLRVRNAGLPKLTLTACIELANQIKSKYNAHAQSSIHTASADNTNLVTSADAYDFPSLVTLVTELIADFTAHNADANLSSGRVYHGAQQGAVNTLSDTTTPITLLDCKNRLDNLKAEYNDHDADATAHSSGNTQQVTKTSEFTVSGGTTASSQYVYYLVAKYTYKVGDVTYVDRGAPWGVTSATLSTPNSSTVTIAGIPTIANGSTENYDTAVIKWEIYRTTQNGTVPYYVKEITNGTTSTTDTASDATISATGTLTLYTNGGDRDNDLPPQCKYIIVVNDVAWYAHVKEGAQVRKYRIRQSVRFDVDSCPESFFVDLEDEIVGMGAINNYPVAFCKNRIYRIEGTKDSQGRGAIERREIARGIGGINHLSIVNTTKGIFFAGTTGFYWTDGFEVRKLSPHLDATYAGLINTTTKKARIYGSHDTKNDRIRWSVTSSSASTDNDKIYVLDLNYPLQPEASFTTETPASGAWSPCCIGYDTSGNFVIGDEEGYIFKSDENKFTDPKIDSSVAPSTWQDSAIVWDYRGPGVNAGDPNNNKIATHLTTVAENVTPLSLQPNRKNNDSGYFKPLSEIRTRDNIVWNDPFAPAWNPTPAAYPWRTFPLIIERRRFPRESLRALYTQVQYTNSNTVIYKSDDYGTATVAASTAPLKTATLTGAFSWPTDAVDYFISFESDLYVKRYLVTARTASAVTFVDNTGAAVVGATKKWQIVGVRKRERFNLVSYSIEFEPGSSSHAQYRGEDGGNA